MVSGLKEYFRSDLVPEYLDLSQIVPSKFNARLSLSNIDSLIASIRENGLLQPVVVRIVGQKFEVVAGNRRLEACRRLHWVRIPCLIRDLSYKEAFELGLVENIERETLSPIEEAKAFQKYVKEKGWGGARELSKKVGRSEEYISHRMALLRLPPPVLDLISAEQITPSTAHELVWMKDARGQEKLAKAISENKISAKAVREAIKLVKSGTGFENALTAVGGNSGFSTSVEAGNDDRRNKKYSRLVDKSILTLRICILRLDSIIEELEADGMDETLRHLLTKKRRVIHNQIDDLIHLKKSRP